MELNRKKVLIALAIGIPSALLVFYTFNRAQRKVHVYYRQTNEKLQVPENLFHFKSIQHFPNEYKALNRLSEGARSLLCSHFLYSSVCESTQKYLDQNFATLNKGLLYVTDVQVSGQGRTGNWVGQSGCLMFSFKFSCDGTNILPLQLALPLSIIRGILKCAKGSEDFSKLFAKYPNDVYLNGNKLSGILVNSVSQSKSFILTIGIGINVSNETNFTSLEKEFPGVFKKDELLCAVLEEFYELVKNIDDPDWGDKIVLMFKERWMHLGKKVKMLDGLDYVVEDIDKNGFIYLKGDDGEVKKTMNRDEIIF